VIDFLNQSRKEVLYFRSLLEDSVIKSTPADGNFFKLDNDPEFKDQDGSRLLADALLSWKKSPKKNMRIWGSLASLKKYHLQELI